MFRLIKSNFGDNQQHVVSFSKEKSGQHGGEHGSQQSLGGQQGVQGEQHDWHGGQGHVEHGEPHVGEAFWQGLHGEHIVHGFVQQGGHGGQKGLQGMGQVGKQGGHGPVHGLHGGGRKHNVLGGHRSTTVHGLQGLLQGVQHSTQGQSLQLK
ncbi:hypothetical protein FQA39_LY10884 [Lamprigera yunnana]|nr:hypothetical protein FQA39_LY10884 [Lamprigera yunnana]